MPNVATYATSHTELLEKSAIPEDFAARAGVRTITEPGELPAELAMYANAVPGMLFVHEGLDGTIFQLRPDVPKTASKYLQQADSSAALSIHPDMRPRLGSAKTVVIAEGTKQALAAAHAALPLEDVLVVGIQGCWGWSTDQVPAPWVDVIVAGAEKVIVIFDADVKSNRNVWDAANRLSTHLSNLGLKVLMGSTGSGASTGIDDYLASRPDAVARTTVLAGVIANAAPLTKRRPAAPRPQNANAARTRVPIVDWAAGLISEPPATDPYSGHPVPRDTLMEAAVRIVATYSTYDDLAGEPGGLIEHDLEINISGDIYKIPRVPHKTFVSDIDGWLCRVPHGRGTNIGFRERSRSGSERIIAAILAHSGETRIERTALTRTG